jgi:hypothetical protein
MPDHPIDPDDEEADGPTVAHDDIMKRLLDYQRQMREGDEGEASASASGEASGAVSETWLEEPLVSAPREVADLDGAGTDVGLPETPAYEERILDEPLARQEREVEEVRGTGDVPQVDEAPQTPDVPDVAEEAPQPRRGFFRSRASRRDADVRDLERATNVEDVPDFDDAASPIAPLSASVAAELESRIAAFERTLQRLHAQVTELRAMFADMAVAADERLGALEDAIAKARAERFP